MKDKLRVFIDCKSSSGGIRYHIDGLHKFINNHDMVQTVSSVDDADIVHWHYGGELFTVYDKPMVVTCHGMYTKQFEKENNEKFDGVADIVNKQLLYQMCNAKQVISVSRWLKNYLLDIYIINAINIPSPIDMSLYPEHEEYNNYILGVIPYIETPSRNGKELFRIAKENDDIQFKFVIAKDKYYYEFVNNYNIPKNITIIEYPMEHSDFISLVQGCNALLNTTLEEIYGVIYREVLLYNKPIIGYKTNPGLYELFEDISSITDIANIPIFFMDENNSVNYVKELIYNKPKYNMRDIIYQLYSWETNGNSIIDVYYNIIGDDI